VARDKLVALGTCIGKFTHSGKFRVTIGALDVLAQYAKYKVCGAMKCEGTRRVAAPAGVGRQGMCASCCC
jgi:hypothetical protein